MYRVGLLADGPSVHKIYADLVDWADRQPDVQISLIIQRAPGSQPGRLGAWRDMLRKRGLYATLSHLAFSQLVKLEQKWGLRGLHHIAGMRDIGSKVADYIEVTPLVSKSGFVHRFSDGDLERVRTLDLDLLIRAGSGILKGEILSAARHGILSIHHGDNRIYRGGPPGFWEVVERQPSTGFVIQRLTEELDGGEVLFRGSMPTEFLYTRNQAMLFERSAVPLQHAVRQVLEGKSVAEPPHIYSHRLYTYPLLRDAIRYVAKTLSFWSRGFWRRLRGRRPRWGVAYLNGDWASAVLWRGKVIPNPPGRFLADPFALVSQEGERYIFLEDLEDRLGRGVISAYRLDDNGVAERLGVVLEESFHLSFPFIFRSGDTLYMCPETAQTRQVRLYRCTEFPLRWEFERVLLDAIDASDTLIFEHGAGWAMLTSIDSSALGGPSELHGYLADDPLGPWTKIGSGPLLMDAERGRNGGLLTRGEHVFRVAQRPGFGAYGRAFSIYRIDRMDEHGYGETKVQDVEPAFRQGIDGTHHLHNDGDFVVFDFMRNERFR
jgi:folate-dependent phosphoribosylglycinamide formyltransferase PurN